MRRSSRRLTITGASVFSASTPVVPKTDLNVSNGSPKWVSADEALTFKTPKFTNLTRRTTITRQNIFEKENAIKEADENIDEGFRRPTMLLISPPGVKTRSRRSSMYVGKAKNVNITAVNKPPAKVRKANNVSTKDDDIVKARKVVQKTNETIPSHVKDQGAFSLTNGKPVLKRPVDNTSVAISGNTKLPPSPGAVKVKRKSGRHHKEAMETETSTTTLATSLQDIETPRRNTRQKDSQLQKSNSLEQLEEDGKLQTSENSSRNAVQIVTDEIEPHTKALKSKTPKPDTKDTGRIELKERSIKTVKTPKQDSLSTNNTDKMELKERYTKTAKTLKQDILSTNNTDKIELKERSTKTAKTPKPDSLSTPKVRSVPLKRKSEIDDIDEIDAVVKKMFSPSSFYSKNNNSNNSNSKTLKSMSKYTSPNTMKSVSSPARSAIIRETSSAAHKPDEVVKSLGRQHLESSFSKRTPSRAAPKARKILGVATPSNICNLDNDHKVKDQKENVDEASHIMLESESKTSHVLAEENISFETENENNVTLSHTSHSQWCTIL